MKSRIYLYIWSKIQTLYQLSNFWKSISSKNLKMTNTSQFSCIKLTVSYIFSASSSLWVQPNVVHSNRSRRYGHQRQDPHPGYPANLHSSTRTLLPRLQERRWRTIILLEVILNLCTQSHILKYTYCFLKKGKLYSAHCTCHSWALMSSKDNTV